MVNAEGWKLKYLMRKNKLSVKRLAEEMQFSMPYMSKVLNGRCNPSPHMIKLFELITKWLAPEDAKEMVELFKKLTNED